MRLVRTMLGNMSSKDDGSSSMSTLTPMFRPRSTSVVLSSLLGLLVNVMSEDETVEKEDRLRSSSLVCCGSRAEYMMCCSCGSARC